MELNDRKRVLIINFYFNPSAAVGAKRFIYLSNLLHGNCCDLHILTVKEKYFLQKDHSLCFSGKVHRTLMFPPFPGRSNKGFLKRVFIRLWSQYLCILDPFFGWVMPALVKGLSIIKKHKIDTIIVTGPPFSPMLTAMLLSKLGGTRLIIDYQDPWTTNPWDVRSKYGNIVFKKINCILEKIVVKHADELVVCSQTMKEQIIRNFGKMKKSSCHVIYNGYNRIDNVRPLKLEQNKKCLVYAGELYGERKIKLLAKAFLQLMDEGLIDKNSLVLHVFGQLPADDKRFIDKQGLENIIREHTPVSFEKIIRYLRGADILVLIIGSVMDYSVSYKFYDYLSVQRPILAIVPKNSEMDFIMNKVDCGEIGYIDNELSINQALQNLLQRDRQYTFSGSEEYAWDVAAAKYLQVID